MYTGFLQAAPSISIEVRDAFGSHVIPRVGMDAPRGHSILLGVPTALTALHIQSTVIPEGVAVVSPRDTGADGLQGLAGSVSGPTEIWLLPGWYQELHCNLLWTRSVSIRGTSSFPQDTMLDCKGKQRQMEFRGMSVMGQISNMTLINGFADGDGGISAGYEPFCT